MKKTRIISLLVILVMVLSLFAACGETPAEQPTKAPATQAPATQAPSGGEETPDEPEVEVGKVQLPLCDEVVDLSMQFMWDQGMAGNYVAGTDEFDGFNWLETQTNVHIDFIEINNTVWKDQFNIMIASNEYPDMIMRFANSYIGGVEHAIEEEIILDVTDLLAEYAPNYKAILDADDNLRKSLVTDKGLMGVFYPVYSEPQSGPTQGIAIRQDWLDELKLDAPVTLADYEKVMDAFMTEKGAEFGIMIGQYGNLPMNNLLSAWNVWGILTNTDKPFYVVDGKVKMGLVSDEYKEYLTMLNEWYNKGYITKDFTSWNGTNHFAGNPLYAPSITTGQTGIFNIMAAAFVSYPAQCTEEGAKFTALPDPVLKEGDKIQVGKSSVNDMYEATGVAISTQCEEWEIAMRWLDWFYTEEGSIFNMCGLEGVTWNYDENGEPWWTDLYLKRPEGVSTGNILYKYAVGTITWGLSIKFTMDRKTFEKVGDANYAARKAWGTNLYFDRTFPTAATFNTEEGEIWSKHYGDFETYWQESIPRFITGERSLDEYDEYCSMLLDDLGGNEMLEIAQSAYDRFMAK